MADGEGRSCHTVTRSRTYKDPVVEAFINACEGLKKTLEEILSDANGERDPAKEAVDNCKSFTCVETEHLSGIYYEDRYIPYRDGTYRLTDAIDEACGASLAEIEDRISVLEGLIAEANTRLWITETWEETVYDD